MRTVGEILSRVTTAMIIAHDAKCPHAEVQGHRWERCPFAPSIYGVGDALDAIDRGGDELEVSLALHDRQCVDVACTGMLEKSRRVHAHQWEPMADALIAHERPVPLRLGD
jgi:hypothetical protein